jgi:hypothetical protein
MSNRKDVGGRLIFTCRCGFIDTGHANPGGAAKLWRDIRDERHREDHRLNNHHTIEGKPCFLIEYHQGMGVKAFQVVHSELFLIRKGLPVTRKKEIALRIFMEVSLGFETMQGSWPFSWLTDSDFSAEDLVSNLIGFYRAVEGYAWTQVVSACKQTSTKTALQIYDAHFTNGIEARKVNEFFKPLLFPCDECPEPNEFPNILTRIRPADLFEGDFLRVDSSSLPKEHWLGGQAIDFDRKGRARGFLRR